MEYFRWLVLKIYKRDNALLLPFTILAFAIPFLAVLIHPVAGVVVGIIAIGFYLTVIYVLLSEAYRKSYAKYKVENKEP